MIRVTHRVGPNTAVSGGPFSLLLYALFVWPLLFGFIAGYWIIWVFWQVSKALFLMFRDLIAPRGR